MLRYVIVMVTIQTRFAPSCLIMFSHVSALSQSTQLNIVLDCGQGDIPVNPVKCVLTSKFLPQEPPPLSQPLQDMPWSEPPSLNPAHAHDI